MVETWWPRRKRVWRSCAVLVVSAPLVATSLSSVGSQAAGVVPPQAAQSTTVMTTPAVPAASWSVVPTPNPSGDWGPGTLDRLNGVSCVSSSFCMASGYFVAKPAKPGVYIGAALFER